MKGVPGDRVFYIWTAVTSQAVVVRPSLSPLFFFFFFNKATSVSLVRKKTRSVCCRLVPDKNNYYIYSSTVDGLIETATSTRAPPNPAPTSPPQKNENIMD